VRLLECTPDCMCFFRARVHGIEHAIPTTSPRGDASSAFAIDSEFAAGSSTPGSACFKHDEDLIAHFLALKDEPVDAKACHFPEWRRV
jgi:hypothetical protein